jgi:hypothetical protein
VIHLPDRALDEDGADGDGAAPVRKKTRRGSRGGKNRRKKPAGAAVATAEPDASGASDGADEVEELEAPAVADDVEELEVTETASEPVTPQPEPAENGDGDWGYTPMSQWGLDE